MIERLETDVCIVGAGYAGLTAAQRLAQAGRSVVVGPDPAAHAVARLEHAVRSGERAAAEILERR